MELEKFKEGTFYYYKNGLVISSKVTNVKLEAKDFISISFGCGSVDMSVKGIKPIKRPGNIIAKFEWCYILRDINGDCLGYVGKKVEEDD